MSAPTITPEDVEYLRQTCEASGVPMLVRDLTALDRLASFLQSGGESK